MPQLQPFQISERSLERGCREIYVRGELDLAVADQLKDALARAGEECDRVLICLEDCQFIDSTGIAVIVHMHHRFAENGRSLALYKAKDQVLRVLSISGLTSNGLVFETQEEALSSSPPEAVS